jgi:hypothetical protein
MLVTELVDTYAASGVFDVDSVGAVAVLGSLDRVQKRLGKIAMGKLTCKRLAKHVEEVVASGLGLTEVRLDLSMLRILATLYTGDTLPEVQEVIETYLPPVSVRKDREYVQMSVAKGDWETRFRPIANRDIGVGHAKALAVVMETVSDQTVLVMYPHPTIKDVFYVLDGQHRIYAASRWGFKLSKRGVSNEPVTFDVQMRSGPGSYVTDQIANLNHGRKYRTLDHLKSSQGESLWPGIFAAYQLNPAFTRSGPKLSWTSIVAGFCMADGDGSVKATKAQTQLDAWRTSDPNTLHRVDAMARILAEWWGQACDGASSKHKLYTLQSSSGIAFALRLWRENAQDNEATLLGVPQRLLDWSELPASRGLSAARGAALSDHLLRGVNDGIAKGARLTINGRKG